MELDPTVEGPVVSGVPPPEPLKKVPDTSPLSPLSAASTHPPPPPLVHTKPSFLTSSFRVRELLSTRREQGTQLNVFVEPRIPDGISLRNFGIQVVSNSLLSLSLLVLSFVASTDRSATPDAAGASRKRA